MRKLVLSALAIVIVLAISAPVGIAEGLPDLVPTDASVQKHCDAGVQISVTAYISNRGSADVTTPYWITVLADGHRILSVRSEDELPARSTDSMGGGEGWLRLGDARPEPFTISVVVDTGNRIHEQHEYNNARNLAHVKCRP